jgi:hypothetical protein
LWIQAFCGFRNKFPQANTERGKNGNRPGELLRGDCTYVDWMLIEIAKATNNEEDLT